MSEAITAMSDSVVNIATEGNGTAERLEAAAEKVQQSIRKIEECKENAAEVCGRIEEKLQQAEEKAMLSVSFAEAAKNLQASFEEAMVKASPSGK